MEALCRVLDGAAPNVREFWLGPTLELLPLLLEYDGGSSPHAAGASESDDGDEYEVESKDFDEYQDGDIGEDEAEDLRFGSAFDLARMRSMQQFAGAEGLRVSIEQENGQRFVLVSRA